MQYLISYLHREQYGALSVAKNPHDIDISIPKMELYKNSCELTYNKYKDIIVCEPNFQLHYFNDYSSTEIIFLLYNYYYLQFLHTAIQNNFISYKWCNLNELDYINYMSPEIFQQQGPNENEYLKDFHLNPNALAVDIYNNGTYFPMGYRSMGKKDFICLGRHRFYSLQQNKSLFEKRKFLFLDFTKLAYIWDSIPVQDCGKLVLPLGEEKIPCFCLSADKRGIFKTKINETILFWNYFRIFSDSIANFLSKEKDFIKPHPIFNNEKAWNKFINSTFIYSDELETFI